MNVTCSTQPCPIILDSTCVFYEGPNLIYSGINTNDSIQTALEKIDAAIQTGVAGSSGSSGTSGATGAAGAPGPAGAAGTSGTNGPAGAAGTSGTNGPAGAAGTSGTNGPAGAAGATGTSGTSGANGDLYRTTSVTSFTLGNAGTITVGTGLSYSVAQNIIIAYDGNNHQTSEVISYNSATGSLTFAAPSDVVGSGTYSSWNVNLAGASGGDGSSGSSGTAGTSGANGTSGQNGATGPAGTSGVNGTSGSDGATGATGAAGTSGVNGAAGANGTSGSDGATGATGAAGTSGTSNGTSGTSGPAGANGTSGTNGAPGATGAAGTSGTSSSGGSVVGSIQDYKITIGTTAGVLSSITSAVGPDGSNLIGAVGWTFTITSNTQFTITHPLGQKVVGAFSIGMNATNALTRTFAGIASSQVSMYQNLAFTQIDFYSLSASNMGYAGSGTGTLIINLMAYA